MNKRKVSIRGGGNCALEYELCLPDCPVSSLVAAVGCVTGEYISAMLEKGIGVVEYSAADILENADGEITSAFARVCLDLRRKYRSMPIFAFAGGFWAPAVSAAAASNRDICDAVIFEEWLFELLPPKKRVLKKIEALANGGKGDFNKLLSAFLKPSERALSHKADMIKEGIAGSCDILLGYANLVSYTGSLDFMRDIPKGMSALVVYEGEGKGAENIRSKLLDFDMSDVSAAVNSVFQITDWVLRRTEDIRALKRQG